MNKQDTVLILASVGTNIIRAKESTYDVIQKELAEYSGLTVYQVFTEWRTSSTMRRIPSCGS